MLISVALSLTGAAMNATASVCQRHESREETGQAGVFRMLLDLAGRPIWWLGVVAMISRFAIEASALTLGRIAVVEPVMIAELPLTVIGARVFLGRRLNRTGWLALLGLAASVAVFVGALAPEGGDPAGVPIRSWAVVGGLTAGFAVVCTVLAMRWHRSRAALLGVATGTAFALVSVLISAVGAIYGLGGFEALMASWQTYVAIIVRPASFFLLQNALQAGSLIASQPGFTLVNPVISVLWGVFVFGEAVRPGIWLVVAGIAAGAVAVVTLVLVRGSEQGRTDTEPDSRAPTEVPEAATR